MNKSELYHYTCDYCHKPVTHVVPVHHLQTVDDYAHSETDETAMRATKLTPQQVTVYWCLKCVYQEGKPEFNPSSVAKALEQ